MYGLAEYGAALYAGPRVAAPPADTAPHTAIEWSPETGALETPAWVDITGDCRYWETSRGRTRELERHQPGRATIVLSNLDRQYDSSNLDGPNVGNLVPRRRVRIRQTFGGVTYPVFDGYVNRWALDYPGTGKDATATIIATDAAGILAGTALDVSVYAEVVGDDSPDYWWRLHEDLARLRDGVALNAGTAGTAGDGAFLGNPEVGGPPLIVNDPGPSLGIVKPAENTEINGVVVDNSTFSLLSNATFTVEAWAKTDDFADVLGIIWGVADPADSAAHAVCGRATDVAGNPNHLEFLIGNSAATLIYGVRTPDDSIKPNQLVHVVCTVESGGQMAIHLDGVRYTTIAPAATATSISGVTLATDGDFRIGHDGAQNGAFPFRNWSGQIAEVAVYPGVVLTADEIAEHYAAGSAPWQADLPGARADRVLDLADWPADLRDLDDGSTTLQSAAIDGTTALEHLQKVGETEFGLLFIDRSGNVRLVDRTAVFARTPDPAIIGDTTGEVGYRAVSFDDGDGTIRNRATISRLNGAAQVASDTASATAYGRYDYTLDGLLHQSDSYSADYADFIVGEYKDPRRRIVGLTLGPPIDGDETDVYSMVLGRELGDAVTVRNRPPGGGDPFEQVSVIEGIRLRGRPSRDGGVIEADWSLSPELGTSF